MYQTSMKCNFGREKYLSLISNVTVRKAITKIRLSAHNFDIETGRQKNIQRSCRYCSLCNTQNIGDEFHVLFKCTNINVLQIRQIAIDEISKVTPSFSLLSATDKFKYCFLASDENIIHIVGNFFRKILECTCS